MASGAYTHTHAHTHTLAEESDYKKPGVPVAGWRAWFKNIGKELNLVLNRQCFISLIFSVLV